MKTLMVPLFLVGTAVLTALTGCQSAPEAQVGVRDARIMHHTGHSHLTQQTKGTFSVSYDPAQFAEAYDVRAARHRNIAILITKSLEHAGLKRTDGVADYEVHYTYRTNPSFSGTGFRHAFDMTIIRAKDATGAYGDDLVWSGSAWIDRWPEKDITYLFASFVEGLLEHFPEAPPKK